MYKYIFKYDQIRQVDFMKQNAYRYQNGENIFKTFLNSLAFTIHESCKKARLK